MKKLAKNTVLCLQPVPQTIVSCRDKEGRNNALVVGFTANVSLDPVMVMTGIVPSRFSPASTRNICPHTVTMEPSASNVLRGTGRSLMGGPITGWAVSK